MVVDSGQTARQFLMGQLLLINDPHANAASAGEKTADSARIIEPVIKKLRETFFLEQASTKNGGVEVYVEHRSNKASVIHADHFDHIRPKSTIRNRNKPPIVDIIEITGADHPSKRRRMASGVARSP